MEALIEVIKVFAASAVYAGLIASIVGGISSQWMLRRSIKRTINSNATELDALFLALSSPGFSRFSVLNSPDTIGIGVYAALALEQVGVLKDLKTQTDVNLKLYPGWPPAYLAAARHTALDGHKSKAREYLSTAKILMHDKKIKNIPQLKLSEIDKLIKSETQPEQSSTSIEALYEQLRKEPHKLVVARSVVFQLTGLVMLFAGTLVYITLVSFELY